MRKNTLYTANPWNQAIFSRPTSGRIRDRRRIPTNVDRITQNIFDGEDSSNLAIGGASLLDSSLNTEAIKASADNTTLKGVPKNIPLKVGGYTKLTGLVKNPSVIGGIGSLVGNTAYTGLSNGLNSGAGSAVNKIGGAVGGIVGKVNPVAGAAVTALAGVVGGGVNRLAGTAVDAVKLAEAKKGTAQLNSFTSTADNFDAVKAATAVANVQDAFRSGVLNKNWAKKRNAELQRRRTNAAAFVDRSIDNNIENLAEDQLNDALSTYAAYGGLLRTVRKRNRRMNKKC